MIDTLARRDRLRCGKEVLHTDGRVSLEVSVDVANQRVADVVYPNHPQRETSILWRSAETGVLQFCATGCPDFVSGECAGCRDVDGGVRQAIGLSRRAHTNEDRVC